MCQKHKVEEHLLLLSPDRPNSITIFGIGASNIPESELKAATMKFDSYVVSTLDQQDEKNGAVLYAQQFGWHDSGDRWQCPVIEKYAMENTKWNCEFVIRARDKNNQVCFFL